MPTFGLVIDPVSEDAGNVPVNLSNGSTYRLTGLETPDPELKTVYASSFDTEGSVPADEHQYENREITARVLVTGVSATAVQNNVNAVSQKVGKLNREQGTLQLTVPTTATPITFDVVAARVSEFPMGDMAAYHRSQVAVVFTCRPFGRGTVQTFTQHSETTLPALVFTETGVKGDVPGLGRMVVEDTSGNDQLAVIWGLQSRYYSNEATAALFYEAEALTTLGSSTLTGGASGASGGGNNVVRQTDLNPNPSAVLSSEIFGTGHLTHVGDFRVWARCFRPTSNTGVVTVQLEWAEGNFVKRTVNDPVAFAVGERQGAYTLVDLGLVHPKQVAQGNQRWEFRPVCSSTVTGDEIDFDCFFIFPV